MGIIQQVGTMVVKGMEGIDKDAKDAEAMHLGAGAAAEGGAEGADGALDAPHPPETTLPLARDGGAAAKHLIQKAPAQQSCGVLREWNFLDQQAQLRGRR